MYAPLCSTWFNMQLIRWCPSNILKHHKDWGDFHPQTSPDLPNPFTIQQDIPSLAVMLHHLAQSADRIQGAVVLFWYHHCIILSHSIHIGTCETSELEPPFPFSLACGRFTMYASNSSMLPSWSGPSQKLWYTCMYLHDLLCCWQEMRKHEGTQC